MKILYVGEIYPSYLSTCFLRLKAIRELGHEVIPLCVIPYHQWGGRCLGMPFRRLRWGPPIWRFNLDLLRAATQYKPELVWVDKGTWVYSETLLKIRRVRETPFVHYTPDPAIIFHESRHFLASIPLYDLLVTTKSYELDPYKQHGARGLLFQGPSFDPQVHRPVKLTEETWSKYRSDVVFIGTYARGRETHLRSVCRLKEVNLAIWGSYWLERCPDAELGSRVRGGALGERDYAIGLCSAKIGLGLLSPLVPDQITTRSVEIPACGTFLLAERTEEHGQLFEEGKEAEFFNSTDELIDKVRYYLQHDGPRRRIAAAGRERCLKSGYSMHDHMAEILRYIQRLRGKP